MATKKQLESALMRAHEAGDEAGARILATELQKRTDQDSGFSFSEMAGNIPSSAKDFGSAMIQPFLHPIETGKAMGNLAMGAGQKLIPGEQPEEIYADQMGQFIKDRYGSMDAFKQTLQNDPVGALADMSLLATGGGGLAARLPGVAGKAGSAIHKAGMAAEPLNIAKTGGRAVGRGAAAMVPRGTPTKMYESAAKFSTTFQAEKRAGMARTALEKGIMPTAKGVDKLRRMMDDFDTQITGLIDDATASGKTIPKGAIYRHLKGLRQKMGGATVEAPKDLNQINRVAKTFDEHLKVLGKDSLTPTELQKFKRDAYKRVNYDAKQFKSRKGVDEARKAMARAAKESIEEVAPVKDLNRQYGAMAELSEPLQRSAARIENRNMIGIGAPINIGAGGAVGGVPGAAAGTIMSLLEYPKIKAKLAIVLKQLQDAGLEGLIDQKLIPTLTQQGLFQTGRATTDQQQQESAGKRSTRQHR